MVRGIYREIKTICMYIFCWRDGVCLCVVGALEPVLVVVLLLLIRSFTKSRFRFRSYRMNLTQDYYMTVAQRTLPSLPRLPVYHL